MALCTSLRESTGYVVRVLCVVEAFLMAIDALRRSSLETITYVTSCTFQCRVRTCKRETGQLSVIEARTQPGIKAAVTLLAICGESTRLMIRRSCIHERRSVAGDAI